MPRAAFLVIAMQVAAQPPPPRILQIYREPLNPGAEAEYDRIESDTARKCAQLRCTHAYVGLESLTGPKEVWWFNGFDSAADRKQAVDAWAKNKRALAVLGRNSKRKAPLTGKGTEVLANYREDLSAGPSWLLGRGRFLVIALTRTTPRMEGMVYEAADGTRFVIRAARTREEADT